MAKRSLAGAVFVAWIGCFSPFAAHADDLSVPKNYEGRAINSIRFEPASQPLTPANLQRILRFEPGAPLHQTDIRDAIKRLYQTGEYQDIEVEWEPSQDGVVLIFRTVEQWFVGPVEVRGKVKLPPSEGQLANATRLELGTPFDDEDIAGAVKGIQGLLERNGLYRNAVEPQVARDNQHQQVSLTFEVDSGKRARLTSPAITGDTKLPKETVAKAAKYKRFFRWKEATAANQQSGVQNVRKRYGKDDRLTASVVLDHVDYDPATNTVKPTISADGGPKVQVKATGAKISKGTLQKYVPVFDEEAENRDLLVRGVANLRDYFQNKGYFDVDVDFEENVTADHQEVTYVIALGERHKVVSVEVSGNQYFKTPEIRERMYLQPAGTIRLRHGRFSQGFAKRDEQAITALYRDSGFRDCKVTARSVDDYQGKAGEVAVTMEIAEGPQYRVGKIDVQGLDGPDRETLVARMASLPGQPFSETNVGLDRDVILHHYQSAGYPDAAFDWKLSQMQGLPEVNLTYVVNKGQPRYVRDVLISGMRATRMRLVSPNMLLKAGEPLSWTTMGQVQRNLYDLGVFDKVDMAIQNQQGDTEDKYVVYHLTEGHRYYVGFGMGAEVARIGGGQDSLDQPAGAPGFSPRGSFEISRLNLWGLGHSVNFKSRYSSLDSRASLSYMAPRYRNVDGRNISVTALYDNTRDVRTYTAKRYEGSVQLSQRVSKATTALWRYTWRNVVVDESTLKIDPTLIPTMSQAARIAMISANIVQDRRDDPVDAHRGLYNTADLGLVSHYLGGNKNFLRFLGRNSYYKRIHHDLVLASNTQFGWIHPFSIGTTDPAQYVPLPERFYGGGSSSHRGFPESQAGPRDLVTGFAIGGNALLFHSTELRFPFLGENITGVLFHDMGNVYSDLKNISFRYNQRDLTDFNYMVHAVGFGVRYRTPVGPLRVDIAYGLNPPAFYGLKGSYQDLLTNQAIKTNQRINHFQFSINIGQAF